MQRTAGDLSGAIASFQRAAGIQEALVYDEPEPLPFSAFHWLGAALLESRRFDDAEKAYRAELKDHPHNGWSLLGLQQALEGMGTRSPNVDADLATSWSRADTWIRSSRF
jgi:tetratricopeptide (TPR) repeat protein